MTTDADGVRRQPAGPFITKGALRTDTAKLREDARALPVDSTDQFLAELKLLSTGFVEGASSDLDNMLDRLSSRSSIPELAEAWDNNPTCKSL